MSSVFCISSVCLFFCLFVCLFVCLSVCLSVCLFVCLNVCMSICLFVYLSLFLFVCSSVRLFVCSSVRLFVCSSFVLFIEFAQPSRKLASLDPKAERLFSPHCISHLSLLLWFFSPSTKKTQEVQTFWPQKRKTFFSLSRSFLCSFIKIIIHLCGKDLLIF